MYKEGMNIIFLRGNDDMDYIDIKKLIDSIKFHFPEDSIEISDALDLGLPVPGD